MKSSTELRDELKVALQEEKRQKRLRDKENKAREKQEQEIARRLRVYSEAVKKSLQPFLAMGASVDFDPYREGTITLSMAGQDDLIITAVGDDATYLSISGTESGW